MTMRVGVVRPAAAAADPLVAEAEARVVTNELTRRLGPSTFDLRALGGAVGPWQPRETAAWPVEIDTEIDLAALWSGGLPPLTTLFGRTIAGPAVEPRAAMLIHLGLVPADGSGLDDDRYARLRTTNVSPTDLWLIAQRADVVTTTDRAVAAFATAVDDPGHAELDAAFDALATSCVPPPTAAATAARIAAERDDLARELAAARSEVDRLVVETNRRFAELERERSILIDRVERADLDAGRPAGSP